MLTGQNSMPLILYRYNKCNQEVWTFNSSISYTQPLLSQTECPVCFRSFFWFQFLKLRPCVITSFFQARIGVDPASVTMGDFDCPLFVPWSAYLLDSAPGWITVSSTWQWRMSVLDMSVYVVSGVLLALVSCWMVITFAVYARGI